MIFRLKGIKCSYDSGSNRFIISWDDPTFFGSQYIVAAAPIENSGQSQLNPSKLMFTRAGEKSIILNAVSKEPVNKFFIAGIEGVSQPDTISLQKEWQYREEFICTGLAVVCTLKYKVNMINDNNAVISIKSDADIPSGYVCYCYEFCGVKFSFPIYSKIKKATSNSFEQDISFHIPKNCSDICVEAPGTAIKLVKKESKLRLSNLRLFK